MALHKRMYIWHKLDFTYVMTSLLRKTKHLATHHKPRWLLLVMEIKEVVFFILSMMDFPVFAAKEEPSSLTAFITTVENKRLLGYVVKQFESQSLISCSQLCLRNGWCTSTNFIMSSKKDEKGTCELNKHDISLINEDTEFHEQEGSTFSMLLKVRCYVLYSMWKVSILSPQV